MNLKFSKCLFFAAVALAGYLQSAAQSSSLPGSNLESLIAYALEHNFAIQQAQESIEEQEGLIIEVKGDFLPNATLNSFYSERSDELIQNRGFQAVDSQDWGNSAQCASGPVFGWIHQVFAASTEKCQKCCDSRATSCYRRSGSSDTGRLL
jgi:outer membrane protein TolC